MIFTSFTFIIFFTILLGFFLFSKNQNYRIYLLLVASYIFYGWWNIKYLVLIFVISFTGWLLGSLIDKAEDQKKRKAYLVTSLVICLSILTYFKYTNFFLDSVNHIFDIKGRPLIEILLPVGISFFTFQTLSYTLDIYRRQIKPCDSLVKFCLFVSFFPQLVAGPIVRASEFLPQLDKQIKLKGENLLLGSQLFLGGALQKIFIADNLSHFIDLVYKSPDIYASITLWLAVLAYSIQIFGDFSGYSLMAIGIAKMLGFSLPKNFNMPYCAQSITEFWRRWHISLSFWLRDYLYIALGGNRQGIVRTQINMFITMLLGGLWHGASWNFVIWGALHGIALGLNRVWSYYCSDKVKNFLGNRLYLLISWLSTLLFVSLLWIPFRSPNFETTLIIFDRLFLANNGIVWLHTPTLLILGCVIIWHLMYQFKSRLLLDFPVRAAQLNSYKYLFILFVVTYLLLLFSSNDASPFIYFQF